MKKIDKYNVVQQYADGLYKAGLDVICLILIMFVFVIGLVIILQILGAL